MSTFASWKTGFGKAASSGRLLMMSCVALVALPLLSARIQPFQYEGGFSRDEVSRMQRNSSAIAMLIGEFRTSLSDILFVKTERYLHSGVAYAPHMDEQLLSIDGLTQELAEHQTEVGLILDEFEDAGTPTLIPTESRDFRGFIGRLEREVKPWRDPELAHIHTDGKQLLPWFRVMTLSDPHYVRGYSVGAWWLIERDIDEAQAFAEEGLANNENAFEIRYVLGQILLKRARDRQEAGGDEGEVRAMMQNALDAYRVAAEHALELLQAAGGDMDDAFSRYQHDDALGAARMAVMLERDYGDPAKALALVDRFHRAYPDDVVLTRLASGLVSD